MKALAAVKRELRKHVDTNFLKIVPNFYKTGQGDYAEGLKFLGIRRPALRLLAKQYVSMDFNAIDSLLDSNWHEEKMFAVLVLLAKYQRGEALVPQETYDYYVKNRTRINNWDLVDNTAAHIIGHFHFHSNNPYPSAWIAESSLWSRRIALVATHYYIKKQQFDLTITLILDVLDDEEDLIHKACGWMLREIGKQDKAVLINFLDKYAQKLPRTALRYAIEHFSAKKRKYYLTNY